MQATLCDICEQPIRGKAFEVHFIHGEAVNTDSGSSRIVQRDGTTMTFLCQACGGWTRDAMEYLRQGHRDASVYERYGLPGRRATATCFPSQLPRDGARV